MSKTSPSSIKTRSSDYYAMSVLINSHTFLQHLSSRIITLSFKDFPETLRVHESLLTQHSPFFKKGLKENWLENEGFEFPSSSIYERDTVCMFIQWLYMQTSQDFSTLQWLQLSKLWVFADYVGAQSLQNQIIDRMVFKLDDDGNIGNISKETLLWTWENTMSPSKLRNIFIDICATNISTRRLHDHFADMHREFLHQLSVKFKSDPYPTRHIHAPRYYEPLQQNKCSSSDDIPDPGNNNSDEDNVTIALHFEIQQGKAIGDINLQVGGTKSLSNQIIEHCSLHSCLPGGANIECLIFRSWYEDQSEDNSRKMRIYMDEEVKLRRMVSKIAREILNPGPTYAVYVVLQYP